MCHIQKSCSKPKILIRNDTKKTEYLRANLPSLGAVAYKFACRSPSFLADFKLPNITLCESKDFPRDQSMYLHTLYNDTATHINRSEVSIAERNMFKVFKDADGNSLESLKKLIV